jgi:transcriptional regulator with PAS, ATPase and Fis domain
VPIELLGESGTGKEVVARALHALSGRAGRLVAVNCGAIAGNLVESELFGSRRGAFSGAEDRVGHVRTADRGTLLLDEIGDLPLPAQAALLRVLQEGEVVPVGDSVPIAVDVRVIAATHRDLDAKVAAGEFRADLLARLGGLRATLPPLRDRREDLGLILAEAGPRALTREAGRALLAHDWPLNIRELRQAIDAAIALAGDAAIGLEHLPEPVRRAHLQPGDEAAVDALSAEDRAVRDRLVELLREHRGNVAAVARSLGKARPQVHRWLRRFHLDADSYRG